MPHVHHCCWTSPDVNEPYAHRRCASDEPLIFSTITRCYDKRVTVFAVAIVAGDSVKYQSFVYGTFVWEIHVRYNNKYLVIFDLSRFSITFFLLPNQVDLLTHCSYHFWISDVLRLKALSHYNVLANVCRRMKYISSTLAYAEI